MQLELNEPKVSPYIANKRAKPPGKAYFIFAVASIFFLYEYFLRVSPSVMVGELMRSLNIQAVDLGFLSAFYFYAYAPMQIPTGLLLDRFGPRKLLTLMAIICVIGALLFATSHGLVLSSLGRFLMGLGGACAFIGLLVITANWFPPHYFALFAGMTQLIGSVGAMVGEAPLAAAVKTFGWRNSMFYSVFFGLLVIVLIWLFVRDHPPGKQTLKLTNGGIKAEWVRLKIVLQKKQTWLIALYSFCIWAPVSIFASTWGISGLMSLYDINKELAASLVTLVWVGVALGSPFIGWLSDKVGNRCNMLAIVALLGAIVTAIILYVPALPLSVLGILLFLFGFAASGQSLSFAIVKENNPHYTVGTASGFNNMAVVGGPCFFLPLVGYLLMSHWNGVLAHGLPIYSANDYRFALFILPVCFIIAALSAKYFIKETHCRSIYAEEEAHEMMAT